MTLLRIIGHATAEQLQRPTGVDVVIVVTDTQIAIHATGLPFHSYGNLSNTIAPRLQNYVVNLLHMGGKNVPGTHELLAPGPIGWCINGIPIYSPAAVDSPSTKYPKQSGYTYNISHTESSIIAYGGGDDIAGGTTTPTPQGGLYHYTDFSFATAWMTGNGAAENSTTKTGLSDASTLDYLDGLLTHPNGHSKILGYALDGYPIYGPMGYTTATDITSPVKKMNSGYALRNTAYRAGSVSDLNKYPMGIFLEDYEFIGLGDLDEYNGRYCITPDYPSGTYAYFMTIDEKATPVYPYAVGPRYFGTPAQLVPPIPQFNNAFPVWVTPAGDLGKIESQQLYSKNLLAIDPTGVGYITYSLAAGLLPRGLQISPDGSINGNPERIYTLSGVAFDVNQDIKSEFTIRATNSYDKSVTDRTFIITVTGNFPPNIITNDVPLGTFLDGTEVNLQLEAIDLNNDPLTWTLEDGELPKGLTLDSNGLISGIIIPLVNRYEEDITGWDESKWNKNAWEFALRSSSYVSNFTVGVTDGKQKQTKKYRIDVISYKGLRADTTKVTADSIKIFADNETTRPPILITKTLGDMSVVNSGAYFAFEFNGVDYDGYPVLYNIKTGNDYGWDSLNWDMGFWDSDSFLLPPGLSLDPITGWLTGYIPYQVETSKTYTFGVYVIETVGEQTSPVRLFNLTILGNLDLEVDWITDGDLGTVTAGSFSELSVKAKAKSGRELFYSLDSGSKLPQGLELKTDGTLSGRISFQTMSFDKGKTTFDVGLSKKYVYNEPTYFDNIYKFTVTARDFYNQISSTNTFSIRLISDTYEPYENLYIRCMPTYDDRQLLSELINNTDIFDTTDVYRPLDPYFGLQQEIKFLVSNGLKANQAVKYYTRDFNIVSIARFNGVVTVETDIPHNLDLGSTVSVSNTAYFNVSRASVIEVVSTTKFRFGLSGIDKPIQYNVGTATAHGPLDERHFNKKFFFGDFKVAQAKDAAGNYIYDVIYVDLIEDTKIYKNNNGVISKLIPQASTNINYTKPDWRNPRAPFLKQNQVDTDSSITTGTRHVKTDDTYKLNNPMNVILPNDLTLEQNDINKGITTINLNTLPEWMVSVQSNFKELGYTSGAVLAYMKPGTGDKALFRLNRYAPFDIKTIPFVSDRYIINNSYTANFDLSKRAFVPKKYTTFDLTSSGGTTIKPVFTVDFAVDRPFDSIDHQTLDYISKTYGLDGIDYNLDKKYIIFATQEAYVGWGNLANDGWNFYQDGIVPGYLEKTNLQTTYNKRGGIWQINVDITGLVTLDFIREIQPGEYVYVQGGANHVNSYQLYDLNALNQGWTVPKYTQNNSAVIRLRAETTFDKNTTVFINNVDNYIQPLENDKYLKYPKIGVFTNGF